MTTRAKARTARRGVMNKTEERYAMRLDVQQMAGELESYAFEAVKVRLAQGAYYTPDFVVFETDGTISFHEVKGHWREAARLRIKVAAEQWPQFRFVAVRYICGAWEFEEF